MWLKQRFLDSAFCGVFNFRTEEAKVRCMMLMNCVLANIAGTFISGALYTAFLAENGIDIVRVGIISFIPSFSWILSIFSPLAMSRLRKRQKVLFFNDVVYYVTVVLGTTIMPLFVEDSTMKTIWFAVFLFIGNACNAILGNGASAWILRFIPKNHREMNTFTAYNNLTGQICATITGILSSVAAAAVAASGNQFWLLFALRMVAFVLYFIGMVLLYLVPKEKSLEVLPQKVLPHHVLTEPLKYRPFVLTALISILWSFNGNLHAGTYDYFLLETVKIPIYFLYISSVVAMAAGLLLTGFFKRIVDRISPYRMVMYGIGVYAVLEAVYAFIAPGRIQLYAVCATISGVLGVGFSMGFNSLFYLKVPEDVNKDIFATFWNLAANVMGFLGAALGTYLLSVFEAHGVYCIGGMEFYSSQLLCMIKSACFVLTLIYVAKVTPRLLGER